MLVFTFNAKAVYCGCHVCLVHRACLSSTHQVENKEVDVCSASFRFGAETEMNAQGAVFEAFRNSKAPETNLAMLVGKAVQFQHRRAHCWDATPY